MAAPPSRRRRLPWVLLLGVLVAAGAIAYVKFYKTEPAPYFAAEEDHFLFGSIGVEEGQGIPYWIWLVLPRVFPEYLPAAGGYSALGLLAKDAHEMPVGLSKVTIGYERVGMNCALCHTASVRAQPDEPPTIVPAAPAQQAGWQQYLQFLFSCASDPRFTADRLLAEISKNVSLSMLDRSLYRFVIVPRTRSALLRMRDDWSWMQRNPPAGRGRADGVNAMKFGILKQPIDTTVGNADNPPVWNLEAHRNYGYQWDGSNANLQDAVVSWAIAAGSPLTWIDRDFSRWNSTSAQDMSSLRRVQNYIAKVQPPKYPFGTDAQLAAAGSQVYSRSCASCHATGGNRTGSVIPAAEAGTDSRRLDAWTSAAATAYNAYGNQHAWKFSGFRKTAGYMAVPLEGVWLRAPYLHNGSVPSLADLLETADHRPPRFWRGYDVYDQVKVGFVTSGPEAERRGTLFDAAQPGNGNAGHLYGTDLSADDKRALLEYLKTL
jgi:mono/diheme cytochrome c family protein